MGMNDEQSWILSRDLGSWWSGCCLLWIEKDSYWKWNKLNDKVLQKTRCTQQHLYEFCDILNKANQIYNSSTNSIAQIHRGQRNTQSRWTNLTLTKKTLKAGSQVRDYKKSSQNKTIENFWWCYWRKTKHLKQALKWGLQL